jgi:uncharacterized protein (TIGR03084 family)
MDRSADEVSDRTSIRMLKQALDYVDECNVLYELLLNADDAAWARPTQFKSWTFNDVVGHLYMFDYAAKLTLEEPEAFVEFMRQTLNVVSLGQSLSHYTRAWHGDSRGRLLLSRWRDCYQEVGNIYKEADSSRRVDWAGPTMTVRSCISARQMETWAHGQALFDALGKCRVEQDRIKNIAIMGINTFAWTFTNRGLEAPRLKPFVKLTAPSGMIWEWNERSDENRLEGTAVDFCRVVTQTRNVSDTGLRAAGETAIQWMAHAQCFAGLPEPPPAAGTRFAFG